MFHEYNTTKTTEKMTEHFIRLDLVIKLRKGHLEKYGDVKRVKRQEADYIHTTLVLFIISTTLNFSKKKVEQTPEYL